MMLKTIVFIIVVSFAVVCGLVFIADELYYDRKPNTDDGTKVVSHDVR